MQSTNHLSDLSFDVLLTVRSRASPGLVPWLVFCSCRLRSELQLSVVGGVGVCRNERLGVWRTAG